MKDKPIIFSAPMVRAILAGHKTQTRRIQNGRNRFAVGYRLWVKETFHDYATAGERDRIVYRATDTPPAYCEPVKWRPSIYMPRWASRLTLEVTGVRIERLREITNDDAKAEGVEDAGTDEPGDYRSSFRELWDVINLKRASWDSNPWVCVIGFKREEPRS